MEPASVPVWQHCFRLWGVPGAAQGHAVILPDSLLQHSCPGRLQALEQRVASVAADFKAAHIAETLWGFGTLQHALSPATIELLLHHISQAEASPQLSALPLRALHHDQFGG